MFTRTAFLTCTYFAMALRAAALEPADPCHNAELTIMVWQSQNTVLSRDYARNPARLVVDGRRWLQLPAQPQSSIALSAFCRIAHSDNPTKDLEVYDQSGVLHGTVSGNHWRNRLTGE